MAEIGLLLTKPFSAHSYVPFRGLPRHYEQIAFWLVECGQK